MHIRVFFIYFRVAARAGYHAVTCQRAKAADWLTRIMQNTQTHTRESLLTWHGGRRNPIHATWLPLKIGPTNMNGTATSTRALPARHSGRQCNKKKGKPHTVNEHVHYYTKVTQLFLSTTIIKYHVQSFTLQVLDTPCACVRLFTNPIVDELKCSSQQPPLATTRRLFAAYVCVCMYALCCCAHADLFTTILCVHTWYASESLTASRRVPSIARALCGISVSAELPQRPGDSCMYVLCTVIPSMPSMVLPQPVITLSVWMANYFC